MGYHLITKTRATTELSGYDFSQNFLSMSTLCHFLPSFGALKDRFGIHTNDGDGIPWREIYEVREKILQEAQRLTYKDALAYLKERDKDRTVCYADDPKENTVESCAHSYLFRVIEYATELKAAADLAHAREDYDELQLCFY